HIYTGSLPALEARWRHLTSIGAYQIGAFVTYGNIPDPDRVDLTPTDRNGLRGYFEANGRFQLDPYWTVKSSLRAATDKTVARRYDITRDDRLRNFVSAERIDLDSYLAIEGWAFQGLRSTDKQERIPIALPPRRCPPPAGRSGAGRQSRAAGQQPRHPSHRGAGHAAGIRQRALG